jgi:hypothetical protein
MMSIEQAAAVKTVYMRFMENEAVAEKSEKTNWTDVDDNLEIIGFMLDEELIREIEIKYLDHSKSGVFRCYQDHKQELCIAPHILEAVGGILELYEETGELHAKNRYILSYYLALSELRLIFNGVA